MPSPFPGMNPYLERSEVWEGFHQRIITHMGDQLAAMVGDSYIVDVETRLYLHELSADERRFVGRSDVSVAGSPTSQPATTTTLVNAPQELLFPAVDAERYSWLEIRDRTHRRIITAIELLSPTNKKQGPDRDDYLNKRARYMNSAIHFVEIDLKRAGTRPSPPPIPACDYYVLLTRAGDLGRAGFWPIPLDQRLPTIPIPLAAPDADISIDLQELLHRVYDAAHYGNWIYSGPPEPPLSAEETAWARQFLPGTAAAS
jgi:hypothetical protein